MNDHKDKEEQKYFLKVPYNWDYKHIFANLWNKETDKVMLPKKFGWGWTINFHALLKKLRLKK